MGMRKKERLFTAMRLKTVLQSSIPQPLCWTRERRRASTAKCAAGAVRLPAGGDFQDGVPQVLDELLERAFGQAFVVGVSAAGSAIVDHRADAVGLHPFGPDLGHVGSPGKHRGQGDGRWKHAPLGGFEGAEHFRVQSRGGRGRPVGLVERNQLHGGVVDDAATWLNKPSISSSGSARTSSQAVPSDGITLLRNPAWIMVGVTEVRSTV